MPSETVTLDNATIAKLAIAMVTADRLYDREVIGPLTRKVLEVIEEVDECNKLANRQ